MARNKTVQNRVPFSSGLITENNPVNQVPNSFQSSNNMELSRNGDIRRRLGIQREASGINTNTGIGPSSELGDRPKISVQEFYWDNPGSALSRAFGVVQTGYLLWFFDTSTSVPSANLANAGVAFNMSTEFNETLTGQCPVSFANINGYLVLVCSEFKSPHYIYYDQNSDSFTPGLINIKVRDLWGVADGLGVTEEPDTLTDAHLYNLLNQGWGEMTTTETITTVPVPGRTSGRSRLLLDNERRTTVTRSTSTITDVFTARGTYPTNAEIQNLWDTDPSVLVRTNSTPAPKGRYVISAFNRGASRRESVDLTGGDGSGIEDDYELNRPRVVKAFSNRIFYGGINSEAVNGDLLSPNYSGTVFFSRIVQQEQDLGKCYQEADPTSESFSELVANDGGFINITEANNIVAMESLGGVLLVFADNGIWGISGPDRVFKANDYSVTKITDTGAVNSNSIVQSRDSIMYWSQEGIYRIKQSEVTLELTAESVIESTIQSFYNSIPSIGKLHAKGKFDSVEQRIRWLFNDTDDYNGIDNIAQYNRELVYDLVLDAWYSYTFAGERIMGYVEVSPYNSIINQQDVYYNGQNVTYNGEQVVYTTSDRTASTSTTKYLTSSDQTFTQTNLTMTLSELSNSSFVDWQGDVEQVDADASLLTSWENLGDLQRRKDIRYLFMFLRRTETGVDTEANPINPSSCLVRTRWDFADAIESGKWTTQREMYRYKRFIPVTDSGELNYGQSVIVTKNRVRGNGRVLAVDIQSAPGKDLHIHGWSLSALGNQEE